MDAPCEIQGSIHVFRLVNNMCPGKWVHIIVAPFLYVKLNIPNINFHYVKHEKAPLPRGFAILGKHIHYFHQSYSITLQGIKL